MTRKVKKKHPDANGVPGKFFSMNLLAWVRAQLGRKFDSGTINQHYVKLRGYEKPERSKKRTKKSKSSSKRPKTSKKPSSRKSSSKKPSSRKPKKRIPKMPPQEQKGNDTGAGVNDTAPGGSFTHAAGGTFTPRSSPIPTSNTFAVLSTKSKKRKKKRTRRQRSHSMSPTPPGPSSSSSVSGSKKPKRYHFVCVEELCGLFGWLFLQPAALDPNSKFHMLIGTFDQEQQRKWCVDDLGVWINSNPQLKKMTNGWDLMGLFEKLSNEHLFMEQAHGYGRASPALFEIVSRLQV